jgi:hypothetical protein
MRGSGLPTTPWSLFVVVELTQHVSHRIDARALLVVAPDYRSRRDLGVRPREHVFLGRVEPSTRPAPPPPRVRWGWQEAMKRQPRTPLTRVRGPLLRKEKLPEMPSQTNTHISGNGYTQSREERGIELVVTLPQVRTLIGHST